MIRHPAGNVIEPGSIKVVPGEGMPHYRSPFEKGDLFIKFDVSFPSSHFADEAVIKVGILYETTSLTRHTYTFLKKNSV